MYLALKAAGCERGDAVLVNTFTLHPVPSAIIHAAGRPVFVESDSSLRIDLEDLARLPLLAAAWQFTQQRFFTLHHASHHPEPEHC